MPFLEDEQPDWATIQDAAMTAAMETKADGACYEDVLKKAANSAKAVGATAHGVLANKAAICVIV